MGHAMAERCRSILWRSRLGCSFSALLWLLACGSADGAAGSSTGEPGPGELRLEGLEFDEDGQMPRKAVSGAQELVGSWQQMWGPAPGDLTLHSIDGEQWLRQGIDPQGMAVTRRLHFAHLDEEAGWALLQHDESESWHPNQWTRIHWLRNGDELRFCELSPPFARADAAVETEQRMDVQDPITGCLGFAWSTALPAQR